MNWTPKKWLAVLLCVFNPSLAMLYLARKWLALFYFIITVAIIFVGFIKASPDYSFYRDLTIIALVIIGMIHCYHIAKNAQMKRPWYSKWYGLLFIVLSFFMPLFYVKAFHYEIFRLPSSNMEPSLSQGVTFIIKKEGCGNYKLYGFSINQSNKSEQCVLERGAVIVFEYPPSPDVLYIKRIVGIGGDEVIYKDKQLTVNNQIIDSAFIQKDNDLSIYQETMGENVYQIMHEGKSYVRDGVWQVPEGHYFVMGDNRDNSSDSRMWGFVPETHIIGHLVYVFNQN